MSTATFVTTDCQYCGSIHRGMCPRIEEIEYHGDGTVKRIKLRADTPSYAPLWVYPTYPYPTYPWWTTTITCSDTTWGCYATNAAANTVPLPT